MTIDAAWSRMMMLSETAIDKQADSGVYGDLANIMNTLIDAREMSIDQIGVIVDEVTLKMDAIDELLGKGRCDR